MNTIARIVLAVGAAGLLSAGLSKALPLCAQEPEDTQKKSPRKKAERLLEKGLSSQGEEALTAFTAAYEADSTFADPLLHRAREYMRRGEFHKALRDLNQALLLKPNFPEALLERATLRYDYGGEKKQSFDDFKRLFENAASPKQGKFALGMMYLIRAKYDQAIEHFTAVLEDRDPLAQAYERRARSYILNNQTEKAVPDIEKALEIHPGDPLALLTLGRIQARQKKNQEALETLTNAIGKFPQWSVLWHARARLKTALEDQEGALGDFAESLKRDPNRAAVYLDRASLYAKANKRQQAIQDYTLALRADPERHDAYLRRARLFLREGDYAQAIVDCDSLLGLVAGTPEATKAAKLKKLAERRQRREDRVPQTAPEWLDRALSYLADKQYKRAERDCRKAIDLEPKNPTAYYRLASVFAVQKKFEETEENLRKAIEHGMAAYSLTARDLYFKEFRKADRFKAFRDTLALTTAEDYSTRGLEYHTEKVYGKAEADYLEALKLNPPDALRSTLLYNLACAYSLESRADEAIERLKQSIEAGFRDFKHMQKDKDLDHIRDDPRYKELIEAGQKEKAAATPPATSPGTPGK